jgi:hypothetical protein
VDRWGTTYDGGLIPYRASGTGNFAWMVLTRTVATKQLWLVLSATFVAGSSNNSHYEEMVGALPAGGNLNTRPTSAIALGGSGVNNGTHTYVANVVNERSVFGALSTSGDFWVCQSILGELAYGTMFCNPVGCKSNDQWPFYYGYWFAESSNGLYPFGGSPALYLETGSVVGLTTYYNGASGAKHVLIQPPDRAFLDASDLSLFDFPCFVIVINSVTPTAMHARGRLPDMGLCSGETTGTASAQRPCNIGTTIRNALSEIEYVTVNQFILPYNAALS